MRICIRLLLSPAKSLRRLGISNSFKLIIGFGLGLFLLVLNYNNLSEHKHSIVRDRRRLNFMGGVLIETMDLPFADDIISSTKSKIALDDNLEEENENGLFVTKSLDIALVENLVEDENNEEESNDEFNFASHLNLVETISNVSCPKHPKQLVGNISVDTTIKPSFEDVEEVAGPELKHGGCFQPNCKALQKLAVVIPFKNRDEHLKTLLFYLHPILMRQMSYYCIFVAEQYDAGQFNKAMIMNAGFREALKLDDFDCVVFHDVDMLPENDFNFYRCGKHPIHLSPAIDKFMYKPHYGTEFGGVTAITPEQYKNVNGHSNQFWGWGGEDNDIECRISRKNMTISSPPLDIGRYKMIRHRASRQFSSSNFRFNLNSSFEKRADVDGLSDLRYRFVGVMRKPTYTKLYFDLRRIEVKKVILYIDGEQSMDIEIKPKKCRWEFHKGKYLDFDIRVSLDDYQKLQNLKPHEKLVIPPAPISPSTPKKDGNKPEDKDIITTPRPPTATIRKFEDAEKLCEAMSPECRGIMLQGKKKYLLKRSGVVRNYALRYDREAKVEDAKYAFPNVDSYVNNCPGETGNIQTYNKTLSVGVKNLLPRGWHTYKFLIEFKLLMKPDQDFRYRGAFLFEANKQKKIDYSRIKLVSNKTENPLKNFNEKFISETVTIQTKEHELLNVPGNYVMESKITDARNTPYFQWNWMYEVSTGDRELDAKIRDNVCEKEENQKKILQSHRKAMENQQGKKSYVVEEENDFALPVISDESHKQKPLQVKARRAQIHLPPYENHPRKRKHPRQQKQRPPQSKINNHPQNKG